MTRHLLVLSLLGVGCSKERAEEVSADAFLRGLPTWEEISPPVAPYQGPEGDGSPTEVEAEGSTGEAYRCDVEAHTIATNPDQIAMSSPDAAVLWPGSLLHGDSHLQVGALRPLAVRADRRGPLSLSLQGGGVLGVPGGVSATIDAPVGSSVREAINQLVANALDAELTVGAGTSSFSVVETHSSRQALLEMGFDARYLGASVEGSMEVETHADETVLTATFVQRLFTVAVDPPETPGDMFAAAVTADELRALGVDEENLPLYIDSVAYGRTLIVTMTSTDSADRMAAALEFSYDSPVAGVGGYASAELAETLSRSDIEVFALGGPNAGVESLISSGSLWAYFEAELAINQVEPISFTVRNLGDNRLATVADTTSYAVETCERVLADLPQPIHWWRWDGTMDDAVGAYDFPSHTEGPYAAGRWGQASSFDGVSHYLLNHLAGLPVPTDAPFTMSAWVYPREGRWHTIASQIGGNPDTGDMAFRVGPSGQLQLWRRANDASNAVEAVTSGTGTIPLNAWSHAVAVYGPGPDGEANLRLYVDGALVADAPVADVYTPSSGTTFFRVGSSELIQETGERRYLLAGELDEMMIFDEALSSDEVLVLHEDFAAYLD